MGEPVILDYQPVSPRRPRPLHPFWRILLLTILVVPLFFFILFSLFAPGGCPAREPAKRVKCNNDLRQIGLAISLYCQDNQGQYPSDVGLLIPTEGLSAGVFVCPSSSDTTLPGAATQPATALLAGNYCSYVYVGAGMNQSAGAKDVVAFELPDNHSREGGNVLWGDAHVSWEKFEDLVQLAPELEAGHNPPVFKKLTLSQAQVLYQRKWLPRLKQIKDGTWAASLPRPATQPLGN